MSLRDEKGSALSEFIVDQASRTPRLDKDFVYAHGQLLVERTVAPAEPSMKTHSTLKTGSAYNFQLTSQTGFASYAVDISGNSGWRRQVSGIHPNAQNVIAIDESNFSAGESNYVRVRIESPQASGYSAPVSLNFDANVNGSSANQIRSFTVSREGTNIILRWALNQSNGKQTRLYFRRADGAATYLLTPQALNSSLSAFTLDSQALASPCGSFWGTQFSVGIETGAGPATDLGSSRPGEQGTQDGCGGISPPGPAPASDFVQSYRHLDHQESLRIARGDNGAPEIGVSSTVDLYPFGSPFASAVVNSRWQFTGHERDQSSGADYLLARHASFAQSRFVSVDPSIRSVSIVGPQSWNRYRLLGNRPVGSIDPTGKYEEDTHQRMTAVLAYAAGMSLGDAARLGDATQAPDVQPETNPVNRSTMLTPEGYHARQDFHFTAQATRNAYQDAALSTGSISIFGIFLHAFQDAYSHSGYNAERGHAPVHTPDKPQEDPDKFMRMAERTLEAVAEFAQSSGKVENSSVPFEVIKSDIKAWAETDDQGKRLMLEYRMRMTIADYRRKEDEKKAVEKALTDTKDDHSD